MKRLCFLLTAAVLLTACTALTPSLYGEMPSGGTVTMDTQFAVYARDTEIIQLALHNGSDTQLEFGSKWHMEVRRGGQWMTIPFRENTAFHDLLYMLVPGGTHVFTVHTNSLDYTLTDGTYRIVKEMAGNFDTVYAAEFTVGESKVGADSPYGYLPLEKLPAEYDDASEDGVIFVNSLGQSDSTVVDAFFSHYEIGMNAQLRLGIYDDNHKLILEDLILEKKAGARQIRFRRDETRAGGAITETIFSFLVTDGEEIYLSDTPHFDKDSAVLIPLLENFDWVGHRELKERLNAMNEGAAPAFWSPDGMKLITLPHTDDPLEFAITELYENGGSAGALETISSVPGMKSLRSVVWTPDGKTAMFLCETVSVPGRADMTGYVFYDPAAHKVTSYTSSFYGYQITADGEIIIPE